MNNNLKERAGMITLISMLRTLTVRLGVAWNWLRNMSSGRLDISSVEPWGTGTREFNFSTFHTIVLDNQFNIPSNTTLLSPDYRGVMYKFNRTTCFGRLATIIRSTRARVCYMQRNVQEYNGIPLGCTLLSPLLWTWWWSWVDRNMLSYWLLNLYMTPL
jgi:hypothetical protein